jgi:hypothetical protein
MHVCAGMGCALMAIALGGLLPAADHLIPGWAR